VNWDRLVYFRAVARLQHISRAAGELGITQPALSRAIARLERDVGVELFDRRGRTIVLTRCGAAFLRRVERALDEIELGRREAGDLAVADARMVSLGSYARSARRSCRSSCAPFAPSTPTCGSPSRRTTPRRSKRSCWPATSR
jgi:DNA-binding transcriptional LysR family regulator